MGFSPNILLTHSMVIANPCCPKSQHAPKGNQDREEVCDQKHGLRSDLEVALDVPESEGRGD